MLKSLGSLLPSDVSPRTASTRHRGSDRRNKLCSSFFRSSQLALRLAWVLTAFVSSPSSGFIGPGVTGSLTVPVYSCTPD